MRVGILATGEFCQTYIAQKKGFFAKNGLDVELIYFQGGSQVIQAMLGGELPLTVTAGPRGDRQTAGSRYCAALANNPTMHFSLYVAPEIKKGEDLRGKTAGISPIRLRQRFFHQVLFSNL
jgi:NitT/TauT family transport system substrate-binding protein